MRLRRRSEHPSDESLLLLLEDEMPRRHRVKMDRHLDTCGACRMRRDELATAMNDVAGIAMDMPVSVDARTELQRHLAAAAGRSGFAWLQPRFALRALALLCLLGLAFTWRQTHRSLQDRMAAYEETGPRPDRAITPGSVRAVALAEVCALPDNDLDPSVSLEKQRQVFRAYGLNEKTAQAYQVDYLINPQLGGNDDVANLWPEPYHATVWNAGAKDALETRLHGMVCSGQVTLDDAQRDLAADWIEAYKKYFHVSRPVRTLASAGTAR